MQTVITNKIAVFIDSSFFLALKNFKDKNHNSAKIWMSRLLKGEQGTIYTSNFVFGELVTVALTRLKDPVKAIAIGKFIMESPRIQMLTVLPSDEGECWALFQRHARDYLSYVDCTILQMCKTRGIDLVATYDIHFKGLIGLLIGF